MSLWPGKIQRLSERNKSFLSNLEMFVNISGRTIALVRFQMTSYNTEVGHTLLDRRAFLIMSSDARQWSWSYGKKLLWWLKVVNTSVLEANVNIWKIFQEISVCNARTLWNLFKRIIIQCKNVTSHRYIILSSKRYTLIVKSATFTEIALQ